MSFFCYGFRKTSHRKNHLYSLQNQIPSNACIPDDNHDSRADSKQKKMNNYGRALLVRDFVADNTQRLPFDDEDTYGGGMKWRNEQKGDKSQVHIISASHGNIAFTPEAQLPVHPKGVTSEQPSDRVNRTVKFTEKASIARRSSWNSDHSEDDGYDFKQMYVNDLERIPVGSNRHESEGKRITLVNFGRFPLIKDTVDDRARPLPSDDVDTFGGGTGWRYDQRNGQVPLPVGDASDGNGASTRELLENYQVPMSNPSEGRLSVHQKGGTHKQKPTNQVNQTIKVTEKKGGCFRWF